MHNSSTMLLGLDIGTSGIKAALFNLQGRELYRAYRAYKPDCDSNDYLSLSVYKVRQSAGECFGEICAKFDSSKIQALAISTQGEAVVPVDADMHPLADAIVSFDSRNEAECQEFCQHFKRHDVYPKKRKTYNQIN